MPQRYRPEIQRKGPLRKIVKIWRKAGPFMQGMVELECGHHVKSGSTVAARCDKCNHPERV